MLVISVTDMPIPKVFIVNLHASNSCRSLFVSFSNHDSMRGSDFGLLSTDIEWNGVNKCFGIDHVIVNSSFVPNFFNGFVVDVSKMSKKTKRSSIFKKYQLESLKTYGSGIIFSSIDLFFPSSNKCIWSLYLIIPDLVAMNANWIPNLL